MACRGAALTINSTLYSYIVWNPASGRNEFLRIILLLLEGLREGGNSGSDAGHHKDEGDDGPDNTPALRRATVALSKHTGVGAVDFSKDEVVTLHELATCGQED